MMVELSTGHVVVRESVVSLIPVLECMSQAGEVVIVGVGFRIHVHLPWYGNDEEARAA